MIVDRKGKPLSRESCLEMVGPGWACLINYFYTEAEKMGRPIHVHQIKEKFAGLRLYANLGFDEDIERISEELTEKEAKSFNSMIHALEEASFKICEECGEGGKVRGDGWLQTLCDVHAKGRHVQQSVAEMQAEVMAELGIKDAEADA
jgi:hypothetical protein